MLVLSALFSGSETALTSMSKLKLKEMAENARSKEKRKVVETALHEPNKLLTTILVFNNLVNIFSSSLATLIALNLFPQGGAGKATAIVTGVMTMLILIFGEITPKVYSTQNSEKVFNRVIHFITFLSTILTPVIWLLVRISNIFVKLMGGEVVKDAPFITEDEIVYAMQVGAREGAIEVEESKMLTRALELKQTSVKEIMIPRVDMVAIEDKVKLCEALTYVTEEGYSRFPVYTDTVDNIVGILYAKDIIKVIDKRGSDVLEKIDVKEISRIPYFVPETKKIDDLLEEFKEDMVHMAIVVDEYGGTEGLVTIEDIIEEVMGEILDEFDEDENVGIEQIAPDTYIIDSKVPLNDIERELDIEFPETDFESMGGYLLEVFEKVPEVGEETNINGFYFRILAASKTRIEKIKLVIRNEGSKKLFPDEDMEIEKKDHGKEDD
ncbi:MAG TPA: hemolysin family protein [Thermotogota bacterium]|nr:hemolysin family protein [Thermotogota bacterium]HPJ89549.1 hemolysin family protein [Thermotogota bacterium]HPR95766.1 hemolysin family protein [Thermotogota bacterium]